MPVQISGVLKDGAGKPVGGCAIELRAKKTSPTVVVEVISSSVTDANGYYSIEAEPGYYRVSLLREGFPPARAGEIYVTPTDVPDTLNAFLDAPKDGDLRPEVMKRFEEMVNTVIRLSEQVTQDKAETETASDNVKNYVDAAAKCEAAAQSHKEESQQNAEAAAGSEQKAGQHAIDAELAKKRVETLADDVQQNTDAVTEKTQRVEQLASEVEEHAGQVQQNVQEVTEAVKKAQQAAQDSASSAMDSKNNADNSALSEQNAMKHEKNASQHEVQSEKYAQSAADYAESAEQAKNDINLALAAMLKTANHLSEIAEEGEKSQQESREHLGLKGAATWDAQSNIYDRVDGRLAIPGAFGYGAIFHGAKSFTATDGPEEFLGWVGGAYPGKYAVTQNKSGNYRPIIANGVVFGGIVEITIPHVVPVNASYLKNDKLIIFYGVNGDMYYNRYRTSGGGYLLGWENLKLKISDFIAALRSCTGTLGDPDVGGLILAAYQGTGNGDTQISMTRGNTYSGSSLTTLSVSIPNHRDSISTATPSITTRGCRAWSLPGTYVALNGTSGNAQGDKALVGLFVRIA